ncbi:hypothetical protein B0I35DRAFT_405429 [Stachybotrys elegans]|uniref:CCHC-type domain-containing protein n=1 Tax=Stachybotrys elegans TaxID=80388 RepID=A0A8K0T441_9HYPO|nr:hypothetical protein B0I35DRAFT_405429 [Stachybotrys elegans]
MAMDGEVPGDVISISSDDEVSVSLKRPHNDSDASSGSDTDQKGSRSSKRVRTRRSRSGSTGSSSSEDGEIDENETPSHTEPSSGEQSEPNGAASHKFTTDPKHLAFMPDKPPIYRAGGRSYNLPSLTENKKGGPGPKLKSWVEVFYMNNAAQGQLSLGVVEDAYNHYIHQHSGLPKPRKKTVKKAFKVMSEKGELATLLQALQSAATPASAQISAEPPAASAAQPVSQGPGQTSKTHINGKMNDSKLDPSEMLEQQRKYFPSAQDPSEMCLLCGRKGHAVSECSHTACKFCGDKEHWHFACPTRSRCSKCRQLGHAATTCAEKLALTKEEGLACAFCASPDHLENDCTEIWRSFHPDEETINQVKLLRPGCAECGSSQHYSTDCEQKQPCARNPTWSMRNLERYLDQGCQQVAIEEAAAPATGADAARGSGLKIRGHASRTNNVHYSESDSEVEFLGAKPLKQRTQSAQIGQIRVASNLQIPKVNGAQPPLPPGPPPSLPPPPRAGQNQRPASLPAKPPTAPRDYRNVPPPPAQGFGSQSWRGDQGGASQQGRGNGKARGGFGQRGGRGGRGRGRGRGRGK